MIQNKYALGKAKNPECNLHCATMGIKHHAPPLSGTQKRSTRLPDGCDGSIIVKMGEA
ncbi:MAG: hypothetical protein KBG10_06280 [Anaerolineaceae bacterium]|nr:hypothetical protein [Anaerolineaceae bacterium]